MPAGSLLRSAQSRHPTKAGHARRSRRVARLLFASSIRSVGPLIDHLGGSLGRRNARKRVHLAFVLLDHHRSVELTVDKRCTVEVASSIHRNTTSSHKRLESLARHILGEIKAKPSLQRLASELPMNHLIRN